MPLPVRRSLSVTVLPGQLAIPTVGGGPMRWVSPTGPTASREDTLPAFLAAFALLGYTSTSDSTLEPNVGKVALYARSGSPTHAARQLPTGRWTSKLGQAEDIEHELLALVGSLYGDVAVILARREA